MKVSWTRPQVGLPMVKIYDFQKPGGNTGLVWAVISIQKGQIENGVGGRLSEMATASLPVKASSWQILRSWRSRCLVLPPDIAETSPMMSRVILDRIPCRPKVTSLLVPLVRFGSETGQGYVYSYWPQSTGDVSHWLSSLYTPSPKLPTISFCPWIPISCWTLRSRDTGTQIWARLSVCPLLFLSLMGLCKKPTGLLSFLTTSLCPFLFMI